MSEIKTKQLIIEIEQDLHNEIKASAAFLNTSIKKYVLSAIQDRIEKEKQLK